MRFFPFGFQRKTPFFKYSSREKPDLPTQYLMCEAKYKLHTSLSFVTFVCSCGDCGKWILKGSNQFCECGWLSDFAMMLHVAFLCENSRNSLLFYEQQFFGIFMACLVFCLSFVVSAILLRLLYSSFFMCHRN